MHAVSADDEPGLRRRRGFELKLDALAILRKANQLVSKMNSARLFPRQRLSNDAMQIAAVNGDIR